eukprot:CAMPEP_0194029022 /NCGR_PEP_ID=MMETSP0009_2-20130614/2882_1 /TAXON_ID=210454 /ORGANISM="Grammatophora oceanica, Strain CCMP 410" /LENGTH=315 /DNA_ID=CAMNT_0038668597 /DNA_START=205 /DNA_END=1152 /DNA_ORIENTATION=+
MNNRLGDIPDWAIEGDDDEDDDDDWDQSGQNGGGGDIEMGGKTDEEKRSDINKEIFFQAVEEIKRLIDSVIQASQEIEIMNEQAMQATTTKDEKALSKRLRRTIDETNKKAKGAKNLLGELKEENEKLKSSGELNKADLRVRENMLNTLTRKFIDEMKNYQSAQQKYKTDIQQKMKRQVLVVKPNATDEEVDEIMKSEGGRDALYKQTILDGGINEDIKTVSAKVAGKYQDVKALEQSVAELHQMFLDFALLVEQQGELLNNIEHQVRSAADHVEEANKDVGQSIEYQKSIRKKQLWIILIVMAVIGAIVIWQLL